MKQLKLLIVMLLAIVASTSSLHAQKGMKGFGADLYTGVKSYTLDLGLDIIYRYNVTERYCLQPHAALFASKFTGGSGSDSSVFGAEIGLDNHIAFVEQGKYLPYFNLGASYYLGGNHDDVGEWASYGLLKGGLGLNVRISYTLCLNIEADYGYLAGSSSTTLFQAKAGLIYTF